MYLTLKTLHIVFITSWFVGLFYMPRILVNMANERANDNNPAVLARLALMAQRLLRFMTVLAVPAIGFGAWMWLGYGITGAWIWGKLAVLVLVAGYHHSCFTLLRKFNAGAGRSERWYRYYNEVPVLAMAVAVGLAVFKPMGL